MRAVKFEFDNNSLFDISLLKSRGIKVLELPKVKEKIIDVKWKMM